MILLIFELSNRLIDVRDLDIDLIYSVNPFRDSYEIMSKTLDTRVFKSIQTYIQSQRVNVTDTEALALWPKINEFVVKMQRHPSLDSVDPYERRLAEVLVYIKKIKSIGS